MSNQLKENLNIILEEKETKLLPENLKVGVTCLGVTGNLEEGIDTSDATATSLDIVSGKTAYVSGEKIEGMIPDYRNIEVMTSFGEANLIGEDVLEMKSASMPLGTEAYYGEGTVISMQTSAKSLGLIPENISKGTSIFGVEGTANTTSVEITDVSNLFNHEARINQYNEILALCKNITTMNNMFYYCETLKTIDLSNIDTSKVTKMNGVFNTCRALTDLDLSNFDTSNVTDMANMFSSCASLINLDLSNFDTSKVTNMNAMFQNCSKLTSINVSNFNTSNVTNVSSLFANCSEITNLDLSSFDMGKVTSTPGMLRGAVKLTHLKSFKNLGKGYTSKTQNSSSYKLDLSTSTNLTHESLMDVINNLYDLNLSYNVANGGTLYRQQLILGSTNLAKLTAEEIAIATNKGWNVS